jgi:hypothetical protein
MGSVYAEEIEEWNTIPPTKKKESARQYQNHWQNINHKIDE